MNAHVGVNSQTKLIHSVEARAANIHDSQVLGDLPHGGETRVWGGCADGVQSEAIRRRAPQAKEFTHHSGARNHPLSEDLRRRNRNKSRVRAKVEHPFLILKGVFAFNKVRNRGTQKNATRLFVACGLVNLFMARKVLLKLS